MPGRKNSSEKPSVGFASEKEMRERHPTDFYPTPPILAAATIMHCVNWDQFLIPNPLVLDPGAGQGIWGTMLREFIPAAKLVGVEFTAEGRPPAYGTWYNKMRYQDYESEPAYDLIIGNPPFSQAEEFILKSITLLRQHQHSDSLICFLLKTSFLHSIGRARGIWKQYPPSDIYHLAKRPSFLGVESGNTDNQEYSIFVWRESEIVRFPAVNKRQWWRAYPFDWTKVWSDQYGVQSEMVFTEGDDDE